jgi:plasmid stabilization system protein ParE
MAHEVAWLPAAIDDLTSIEQYLAAHSTTYAGNVVRRILAAASDLAYFPQLGRVVRDVKEIELRERIVYQYRVVYHVRENQVRIVAVVHGARLLSKALADREF